MRNYKFMDDVKLEPWIGSRYSKQELKTLVLGLSLYSGYVKKGRVKKMISAIRDESWRWAFFTKIFNTFNINNLEWSDFWESIAFYEYLQYAFQEPKQKIEEHHWDNAVEPFTQVIKKIKPDIILALGKENYKRLPDYGDYYTTIKYEDIEMQVWKYNLAGKEMFVCEITHPSYGKGFSPEIWKKVYQKFYRKIKKELVSE